MWQSNFMKVAAPLPQRFCRNCGVNLTESTNFCTNCGSPITSIIERFKSEFGKGVMGKVPQSMDRPSCEAYESPDRNVRLVPSNAANQPYIDWIKRKNLVKTLAQKEVLEWSNTLKSGERTELVKETWLKNATLISGLRVLGDSSVRIFSSETRTPVILMDEQGACLLIAPLLPRKLKLTEEAAKAKKAITWQNDERLIGYFGGCKEFFEDRTQALGCRIGQKGFLMVTNHRLLFACKVGWLAKDYAITYAIN